MGGAQLVAPAIPHRNRTGTALYVVHLGDIRQQGEILYLPVYMTPWLAGDPD